MISNPGDNRTALIAALIAIPASALISMGVHTFVPVEQKPNVTVVASSSEMPRDGRKGFRKGNFNKEDFKKRFMAIRKARFDALKKIVDLNLEKKILNQANTMFHHHLHAHYYLNLLVLYED